ncbi:MAG: hypothetical protein NTAFB01_03070 [Nitrospira sp.]
MRTDRSEGFLFDRGFQVLQNAYSEAQRMLDMPGLDLRPFYPGALVRYGGRSVATAAGRPRRSLVSHWNIS